MNPILGEYSEHFLPDNGIAKLVKQEKFDSTFRGRLARTFVHLIDRRTTNSIIPYEKIQFA